MLLLREYSYSAGVVCAGFYSGGNMAVDAKKFAFEVDVLERAWLRVGLEAKRDQLVRARTKESTGSEIWVLRGKEIETLNALIQKFV